jgi:hypothetical protein
LSQKQLAVIARSKATKQSRIHPHRPRLLRCDVRQGPDGALWLATDSGSGRVIRLSPAQTLALERRRPDVPRGIFFLARCTVLCYKLDTVNKRVSPGHCAGFFVPGAAMDPVRAQPEHIVLAVSTQVVFAVAVERAFGLFAADVPVLVLMIFLFCSSAPDNSPHCPGFPFPFKGGPVFFLLFTGPRLRTCRRQRGKRRLVEAT